MAERRYLTGAIQKDGRLTPESVRFLQIGCSIADFQLPTGRRRFSLVEDPPLKIGTEKNGGLARGVAEGKYDWAIAGLDTVEDLPDELLGRVVVVRKLGFQPCLYRLGVSELALKMGAGGALTSEVPDNLGPKTLEDLRPGTRIATKHVNYLRRIVRHRGLNLEVQHDSTPETAPELWRGISVVADIVRSGDTFREHNISYLQREVLLESEAVLIKPRRLPWGVGVIFNYKLLPRVDQALANPERWLNPATPNSSENDSGDDLTKRPRRKFWSFYRMSHGSREIAASTRPTPLLTTLFTLQGLSAILNSWHLGTSGKKDSRN